MRNIQTKKTKLMMNRFARIGLLLLLTMAITAIMPHGWLIPKPAEAAIQYVGGRSCTGTNTAYSCSLTGLTGGIDTSAATNDLVIVVTGWTSAANGNPGVTTPAGYTEVHDLYSNDTRDANLSVNWKIMGATPDTTVTVSGSGNTQYAAATVVHVWRGVDPTTPMDATSVGATGINGMRPDSPAITPVTPGAYVLIVGLGTGGTTQTALSAPAGYGNAISIVGNGSTYDTVANIASIAWTGGAVDPAAWTGGVTSTSDSWAAATLALRPITTITVGTTGTQTAAVYRNTTNNYVGGAFTFTSDGATANVTSITLSEQGTIAANTNLSNVKIYYETAGTCRYDGTETLFGTAASFNASQQAVITGTIPVGASQVCAYVVLDVASGAAYGDTIEIQITDPSTQVLASPATVAPATAVAIANTTTVSKLPSTISDCSGCHGYTASFNDGTGRNVPVGDFPGSHQKHVVQDGIICSKCHTVPGSEDIGDNGHRNGTIQMATNINGDTGGAYGKGTSWSQMNSPTAFTACSNVYCHSQGTSKTSNTGETRTSTLSAPAAVLNWGDPSSCSSCHGYPPNYANGATTWGAAKANSHAKHPSQCSMCHYTTTTTSTSITGATHADKIYDIASGNGITIGSYTYGAAGGTCTTISCHNDGTGPDPSRQWGGTLPSATYQCITCHSVAIGSRDAVVGEFGMAYNHGAADNYKCGVCHMEGAVSGSQTTGLTDPAYHGNGTIELRDPNTGTQIQGVTFDGTTPPGNYVGTGSALSFTKFSRNLGVAFESDPAFGADAAIQINQCLHCHDAGGSVVYVPGGSATNPFASGVPPADVDAHFNTANASYHPIKGRQNNSYADIDTMVAPYNQNTKTAGTTNQWGELMSCFDCHAASGANGVQTRTVVAHGGATTLRAAYNATTDQPTSLCVLCHTQSVYWGTTPNAYTHVPNLNVSALNTDTAGEWSSGGRHDADAENFPGCTVCHGTTDWNNGGTVVLPSQAKRAENSHGFDTYNGTTTTWPSGARAWAFLRFGFGNATPNISNGWDNSPASCNGNSNMCGDSDPGAYTPGGTF